MKSTSFVWLMFISIGCFAQNKTSSYPEVKVIDWDKKAYCVAPAFWDVTKDEILTKIDQRQLDTIKKYADNGNMPDALLLFDGNKLMCSLETYFKRLGSLKVYKVLECTEVFQGKNWGKFSVLAVPYQKLYWDSTAKWDTVYFVVSNSGIRETKN